MSFGFPKFGFRFKRRRGRSLGGSDVQAPTWVKATVIGDRLVGSFTYPDALSPTSRFELWSKLVGEADSAAVLVSAVAQTFDVPFNYVAITELLGGNRGFESGDDIDWTLFDASLIVSDTVHSGAYSATLGDYGIGGTAIGRKSLKFSLTGSTVYDFSYWRRAVGVQEVNYVFQVSWFDSSDAVISTTTLDSSAYSTAAWARVTASAIAPAGAVKGQVLIQGSAGAFDTESRIDDFSAIGQPSTNITPLFALKAYDQADRPSYFSAWFQPAIISHTFFDPSNPLKQMTHSVAGLTAGTLRTATWPNKSGTVAMTSDILSGATRMALFSFEDSLLVAAGKLRIYNKTGQALTISGVYLAVNTAPGTNAIIVDVNKNGTTIFTNQAHRPQIAAAANFGSTTTIDVASLADGDYLTCDIDQVGIAGASGLDLVVEVVAA